MTKFCLKNNTYFSWMQLINALTCSCKRNILEDKINSSNLCVYDNHFIKISKYMQLINLIARNYIIQNIKNKLGATSQLY